MSEKKKQLAAEKRRELEEKRRRWMLEREHDADRGVVTSAPMPGPTVRDSADLRPPRAVERARKSSGENSNPSVGQDVVQLTRAELSEQIRQEVARSLSHHQGSSSTAPSGGASDFVYRPIVKEAQTVDVAAQHKNLEQYVLQTEANSHTCKVCFELMVSPSRTPMFLYPCGHTFCKECMNKHTNQSSAFLAQSPKPSCPFCRTVIQSMVPNQAVKELVDQYAERRDALLPPIHKRGNDDPNDQAKEHYATVISSCEIRRDLIQQEISECRVELEQQQKKKRRLDEADAHLYSEKESLLRRIADLNEELALLESHLQGQAAKHAEVDSQIQRTTENITLLENTLSELEGQVEAARIFFSAAQGNSG